MIPLRPLRPSYHVRRCRRRALGIAAALLALHAPPAGAFELQGHRGARGLAPENTLPAFARALTIGVDTLELDVVVTADEVLVVGHDPELNPAITRDATGRWIEAPRPILGTTLAELRRYDVGRIRPESRYAAQYPTQVPADGTSMPTLAEVAALLRERGAGNVRLNVETKLSPLRPELAPVPERFAELLVAELDRLGLAERATVQSFDWRTLRAVQERAPAIPTVCLTAEQRWLDNLQRGRSGASPWLAGLDADAHGTVPALVQAVGCRVWSPYFEDLRAGDLADAQGRGLRVLVWTVNEPPVMERLIEQGVDGIITDYPDRLRAVMARLGLALPPPYP